MAAAAAETPPREIDPLRPWYAELCHGWPRAKQNPGNWQDEGLEYLWDLPAAASRSDTHACHPSQRGPLQYLASSIPQEAGHKPPTHTAPVPMVTASAGSSITLMFGGNGHSRGNFGGVEMGDPGKVSVYWAGSKEKEIVDVKELTEVNLMQRNGFSEESFAYPLDKKVTAPWWGPEDLHDKGNWQTLHLPECMEKGRHVMIWVWSFGGANKYSTCFGVMVA
ncbi:hypothetical protein AG0111_0g399 [Alternaria gaisen]|uniref:Uncharacterized protein n=1 Tax=Alternaria gaisen TaxID=167740 RepID=A0ACB6FYI0_9PLEO|nr:hypothetical protein AG0111_0g399 [Alternaria gaisen]